MNEHFTDDLKVRLSLFFSLSLSLIHSLSFPYPPQKMLPKLGGKRQTLQEIDDYLINSSKPAINHPIIPKKNRPNYWKERKKALMMAMQKTNLFSRHEIIPVKRISLQSLEQTEITEKIEEVDNKVRVRVRVRIRVRVSLRVSN
jgi:hypothetical protein